MTARARNLVHDIHALARAYHWREADILALKLGRRAAYLTLLDDEATAALIASARES